MKRRDYLKSGIASLCGISLATTTASARRGRSRENLPKQLAEALREDEKRGIKSEIEKPRNSVSAQGSGSSSDELREESETIQFLNSLSPEQKQELAEQALVVKADRHGDQSVVRAQAEYGGTTDASVYGEYSFAGQTARVFTWYHEIEFYGDSDVLTQVDERYWEDVTFFAQSHGWRYRGLQNFDEDGGVNQNRYRLYTQPEFAMCASVGPIGGCTNYVTEWLESEVYANGHFEHENSL